MQASLEETYLISSGTMPIFTSWKTVARACPFVQHTFTVLSYCSNYVKLNVLWYTVINVLSSMLFILLFRVSLNNIHKVGRIEIVNSGMPVGLQFSKFMKLDNRTREFSGFTTKFNYLFTKTQLIIIYDSKKFFHFYYFVLFILQWKYFSLLIVNRRLPAITSRCCHTIFIKHLKNFVCLYFKFST